MAPENLKNNLIYYNSYQSSVLSPLNFIIFATNFSNNMNQQTIEYYEERKNEYEREIVYSGFGWFLFTIIGISAKPRRVEFHDKTNGKLIASFSDEETRKKYIGR